MRVHKIILALLTVFVFSFSQAQEREKQVKRIGFQKTDKFISGAIGYSTTSYPDDSKANNFNIAPRFGYFINDFVALGAKIGFSSEKREATNGQELYNNQSLTLGVFGRYYLLPGNRFSVFGEIGVGFGTIKNTTTDSRFNGVNASFNPGLSYFISESFAIEANLGVISYDSVKQDINGADAQEAFEIGLDLNNINLALIYKF
ncbi:porin family protein [Haloflavibacter putidus]|uniref:Porin family protein n=1 Tax=Haloflavibacter putidus TaxID=2576776 RepID=A0A507ZKB0_9FLAO|nr:porin family protein [Haloflavibacter putidus]TQD36308.1 porin family protein [Haloflavibacter putidus]